MWLVAEECEYGQQVSRWETLPGSFYGSQRCARVHRHSEEAKWISDQLITKGFHKSITGIDCGKDLVAKDILLPARVLRVSCFLYVFADITKKNRTSNDFSLVYTQFAFSFSLKLTDGITFDRFVRGQAHLGERNQSQVYVT